MTMFHEIESAYVLGDFALRAGDRGWTILPPQPLRWGPWNEQGLPFYAEGVSYEDTFELPEPKGDYAVRFPAWYGSVAEVHVNGRLAGHLISQPWKVVKEAEMYSLTSPRIFGGQSFYRIKFTGPRRFVGIMSNSRDTARQKLYVRANVVGTRKD